MKPAGGRGDEASGLRPRAALDNEQRETQVSLRYLSSLLVTRTTHVQRLLLVLAFEFLVFRRLRDRGDVRVAR